MSFFSAPGGGVWVPLPSHCYFQIVWPFSALIFSTSNASILKESAHHLSWLQLSTDTYVLLVHKEFLLPCHFSQHIALLLCYLCVHVFLRSQMYVESLGCCSLRSCYLVYWGRVIHAGWTSWPLSFGGCHPPVSHSPALAGITSSCNHAGFFEIVGTESYLYCIYPLTFANFTICIDDCSISLPSFEFWFWGDMVFIPHKLLPITTL